MTRFRRTLGVLLAVVSGAGLVWTVLDRRINGNTPWIVMVIAAAAAVLGYVVTPKEHRHSLR